MGMSPAMLQIQVNAPRTVHDEIDGEVIAIDLATGTYFSMRGVARAVWWSVAAGPVAVDEMIEALLARYPDAPANASDDVRSFVGELVAHELVREAEGPTSPGLLPSGELGPYELPVLETFTDMQELVLLDPVHEVDATGWPSRPEPQG